MSSRTSRTTSSSVHANTPVTSDASTIAGSLTPALVVILLVVLGILSWKKKKLGMQYTISVIKTYISTMQFHEK